MQFIFILPKVSFEVSLIDLLEIGKVIGASGVDAFVEDEVFAFFLWDEGVATMGTPEFYGGESAVLGRKSRTADFAQELAFGPVVFVEKGLRCIASGAGAAIGDVTFGAAADRVYFLTIAFFVVREQIFVSPVLPEVGDKGEGINFEFLILRGMGIIKSPLFEGDISADEADQPAVLLIKVLNKRE